MELRSMSEWHRFFAVSIGCQSGSESPSKRQLTVYKCLHVLAPPYLTEHCTKTSDAGCRHLRSANTRQLVIPRTRTSYGDRSFSVCGPTVFNSAIRFAVYGHLAEHFQEQTENISVWRWRTFAAPCEFGLYKCHYYYYYYSLTES